MVDSRYLPATKTEYRTRASLWTNQVEPRIQTVFTPRVAQSYLRVRSGGHRPQPQKDVDEAAASPCCAQSAGFTTRIRSKTRRNSTNSHFGLFWTSPSPCSAMLQKITTRNSKPVNMKEAVSRRYLWDSLVSENFILPPKAAEYFLHNPTALKNILTNPHCRLLPE